MKPFIKLSLVTTIFFVINGCSDKKYTLMQTQKPPLEQSAYTNSGASRYVQFEYRIQPHDRLAVTAYKYPEITPMDINKNGLLVDGSGYVSLPLIHRVKLAGLTQPQATKKLERLYRKYLRDPSFNVEVLNKRVYVLGEVKKPGVVPLDRERLTVLEALAYAGDLTDNAVRDNIVILSRDASGKMSMRKVDITNFNSMQASNMLIKPNDIIYVQPDNWKKVKVNTQNLSAILGSVSAIASPYFVIKNL